MIHNELFLPALRAKMGDWTYYITSMTLAELVERVDTASVVHQSDTLDELIQRSLTPRARHIADYLISQPQRLFGTLVVGVYGGEPEWIEVAIHEPSRPWPDSDERLDGTIGLLRLSGSEELFALDGQHRVVGTRRALKADPSLGDEEVAVIFVGHSTDQAGLERTRRLFSTLNRYAKPVSKGEIIALDEDDAAAIVTRRLVAGHPLFKDRVAVGKTKAIHVSDGINFTSIIALYDCVGMIIRMWPQWNKNYKKIRPSEATLNDLTHYCERYWNLVVGTHEALQVYIRTPKKANPALAYRDRRGGHLLFRPIGILAHTSTAMSLCTREGADLPTAIRHLAEVPMELNQSPWLELLWDSQNERMITSPEAQRVARWLMYYAVGGRLEYLRTDENQLRQELAGLLNRAVEDVELPRYGSPPAR